MSKCTPDKIMLNVGKNLAEQTYFQRAKKAVGLLSTSKHLVIYSVPFVKPFSLLPLELTPLILLTDYYLCVIPSVVYLNMLSFLCLHHLRDHRGKRTTRRDLELTIRERYFIVPHMLDVQIANACFRIANNMM